MHQKSSPTRSLKQVIIAFFVLAALSLVVVYATNPSIYTDTLLLTSSATDRYPWPATLFLAAILVFLVVLVVGVVHHWRWLFWLLLIAFGSSILEIPATLLQLASLLPAFPGPFPLWYSLYRMSIALLEAGIAVWMFQMYRRFGVWGLKTSKKNQDRYERPR